MARAKADATDLIPFPMIVGRGRSGTTLLRGMLDSHSEMAIPPESHFVVPLGSNRRRYERDSFDTETFCADLFRRSGFRRWGLREGLVREALASPAPGTVADAIRRVYETYARSRGKARYGDKTPIHVLHVEMLSGMFPESRFVHVIRDGRDVALSYLDQSFGPDSLEDAAIRWRDAVRAGRRAGRALGPARYRELRYEDLVAGPDDVLREVCWFIDLPFEERMLRYYERAEQVGGKDSHHGRLRLPPTRDLRDWRRDMSPEDLTLFETLAGDMLAELGYELSGRRPSAPARIGAAARWIGVQSGRAARRFRKVGRRVARRTR